MVVVVQAHSVGLAAREAIASAEVVAVATQTETLQAGQVMAQVVAVQLEIKLALHFLVALQMAVLL